MIIEARLSATLPGIPLTDDRLPEEIQWMPPGQHTITATRNGEPYTTTVTVNESAAQRLQSMLDQVIGAAAAGRGDRPYIDFNHRDDEAAGHVMAVRWAGDDPQTGGIRIRVAWTDPGRKALSGRAYRRFSPSFQVDAAGEVTGAPLNMGGLVNRAAFRTINPIWSRAGQPDGGEQITQQQKGSDMSEPNKQLADLQTANTQLTAEIVELKAKLATADQAESIRAKDAEITALKGQVESLNARLADQAKANAKAIVDAAIKAGKLAPQATELQAKWVEAITLNPALAETLYAMSPNPALAGQLTGGSTTNQQATGTTKSDAEKFVEAVHAKEAEGKTKVEAINLVRAANKDLHIAWLKAGGGML